MKEQLLEEQNREEKKVQDTVSLLVRTGEKMKLCCRARGKWSMFGRDADKYIQLNR